MSAHEFYVGQKVVCVEPAFIGATSPLVEGDVYEIRAMQISQRGTWSVLSSYDEGKLELFLTGILNPCAPAHGFDAKRFRPVQEKPDAIEWARQICRDVGTRTKAPALRTRSPA